MFRLEREALLRLDDSLGLEWLETDGCGGYASSTVPGCNRRRYHGLLVVPIPGSAKRYVFLSRLEDMLWTAEPIARS
ncbi:MAG TPA: glycogen debranching enzyme N-terminal domain-containing protein, partial [Planctomycetota bacterium]|nr:glycogen debranching enzyme N-terminal domain-containing protein [Planctomycetota bacterium]